MNIIEIIESQTGLTPREIAKKIKISKSYYSMLRSGDRVVSKNLAIKIHDEFNIPLESILIRPEVHESRTKINQASTGTEG